MSSFVISKIEYIKAAGLMYGIESTKRCKHMWFMDNVKKFFTDVYKANVESVNEQYGDSSEPDHLNYDTTFSSYAKKGARIWIGCDPSMNRNELRRGLWQFFNSALYQIENDDLHRKASELFFTCITKLYNEELDTVDGWWGRIDM